MDIMRRHFNEERTVFVLLDELAALGGDDGGYILVVPERRLAAGLFTETRDAVDKRARLAALHAIIELDRVGRIKIHNAMILDPNARGSVGGGRDDPGVIETDFQRSGIDLAVVVGGFLAQTEVPLADDARGVTGAFQQRRHGGPARFDEQAILATSDACAPLAEGIFTGKKGVARRRASCRGRMAVGKS